MPTLLIVDDEANIRRAYKRILKSTGWTIIDVPSPLEAQQYVKQVDAVLSDWDMPNGGGSAIVKLFGPQIVVIVSGRDVLPEPVTCQVLLKPAPTEQIIAALTKIVKAA